MRSSSSHHRQIQKTHITRKQILIFCCKLHTCYILTWLYTSSTQKWHFFHNKAEHIKSFILMKKNQVMKKSKTTCNYNSYAFIEHKLTHLTSSLFMYIVYIFCDMNVETESEWSTVRSRSNDRVLAMPLCHNCNGNKTNLVPSYSLKLNCHMLCAYLAYSVHIIMFPIYYMLNTLSCGITITIT